MNINGDTFTVDVSNAEIKGEPAAGLEADVDGTLVEGIVVAREVKIEESE
ncbi:hypothetical protein ACFLV1_02805 [Chloroflexota bacterium]